MKPFTPVVRLATGLLGQKKFNSIRGKAIAIHTQVINQFCTFVGSNQKMRQNLIRVAKKNGTNLGFLD